MSLYFLFLSLRAQIGYLQPLKLTFCVDIFLYSVHKLHFCIIFLPSPTNKTADTYESAPSERFLKVGYVICQLFLLPAD